MLIMSSFNPFDYKSHHNFNNDDTINGRQQQQQTQHHGQGHAHRQHQRHQDPIQGRQREQYLNSSGVALSVWCRSGKDGVSAGGGNKRTEHDGSDTSATPAAGGVTTAISISSGLGYGYHRAKPKSLFPWKLRQLLNDAVLEGNSGIISWLPDGMAFKVYDPASFASRILKRYFRQSRFRSFTRQLYHYGFERVHTGLYRGAFRHEFFQRDNEDLCLCIGHKHKSPHKVGQQQQGSTSSEGRSIRSPHSSPIHAGMQSCVSTVMQQDRGWMSGFNAASLSTHIYPITRSALDADFSGTGCGGTKAMGAAQLQQLVFQSQPHLLSHQQPQNPLDQNNKQLKLNSGGIDAMVRSLTEIPSNAQKDNQDGSQYCESQTQLSHQHQLSNNGRSTARSLDLLFEPRTIEEMIQRRNC